MKNKISKKVLSVVLAFACVFSTVFVGNLMPLNADAVEDKTFQKIDKYSYTANYDNISTYYTADNDGSWSGVGVFKNSSLSCYPSQITENDTPNGIIAFRTGQNPLGAIYVGASFENSTTVKNEAVKVVPGKTYTVSFKYKTPAATEKQVNAKLSAGDTYLPEGETDNRSGNTIRYDESSAIDALTIPVNTNVTDWVNVTKTYTAPADLDTATYPYLILAFSNDNNTNTIVYVDDVSVQTAELLTTKKLSFNDYESVTKTYNPTSENWSAVWAYKASSLSVVPVVDPTNADKKALAHICDQTDRGALYFGADYTSADSVLTQALRVEAGKTYFVSFKYRTEGTSLKAMDLYLGAGNTVSAGEGDYWVNKIAIDEASQVKILSFAANTNLTMDGWKTLTATYTAPTDLDTTTYPYLLVSMNYNQKEGTIFFDDVSAEEVISSKSVNAADSQIVSNDYENVTTTYAYSDSNARWGAVWAYKASSLSVVPVVDPTNADKKALAYICDQTDRGALYFGADYTSADSVLTQALRVEAGKTYLVSFKYRTEGTSRGAMDLYLGAGNTVSAGEGDYWVNKIAIDEASQVKILSFAESTNLTMDGWKTLTASYTAPTDLDTTTYPYLLVSMNYNKTDGTIFFDDVTVTDPAGVLVEYYSEDDMNTVFYPDGRIQYFDNDETDDEAPTWYYDEAFENQVNFETYARKGEVDTVKLYAKFRKPFTVKYFLNQPGDAAAFDGIDVTTYEGEANVDTLADAVALYKEHYGKDNGPANLTFDGWYTLSYNSKDSTYALDKKVNSVTEAIALGGKVFAKWNYSTDASVEYDFGSNYLDTTGANTENLYSKETIDGLETLKFSSENYVDGMKAVNIIKEGAHSNLADYYTTNDYARLLLGNTYKVSIKYKVTKTDAIDSIRVALTSGALSTYWSDSHKVSQMTVLTAKETTDGWAVATAYFRADKMRIGYGGTNATLKPIGYLSDALQLVVYGKGDIYFDSITVTALTESSYSNVVKNDGFNFKIDSDTSEGVVSFDGFGDFGYNIAENTITVNSDKYEPKANEFKVNGSIVYKNPDLNAGTFNGNDTGKKFVTSFVDGESNVSVKLYDKLSDTSGANFAIVAAEKKNDTAMRFILRAYAGYDDIAYYNGKEYEVVDRGVYVARTLDTLDANSIFNDAAKFSCTGDAYNSTGAFYDYTLSVNGINEIYDTSKVYVGGYMLLTDNKNSFTVYTNNIVSTDFKSIANGFTEAETTTTVSPEFTGEENPISSVVLSLYDTSTNSYGLAWQSLPTSGETPIIQYTEAGEGEPDWNSATVISGGSISSTPLERFRLKAEYESLKFETSWGIWQNDTYREKYVVNYNKGVIGNLASGKTYYYRVGDSANGSYSSVGKITVPESQNNGSFKFLYIADTQQWDSAVNHTNATLNAAYKHFGTPEFIHIGGDLVHYTYEHQWKDFLEGNKRYFMSTPVMAAAGNHEWNMTPGTADNFISHFNVNYDAAANASSISTGVFYSYDYKNTHFVVLNTNNSVSNKLSDAQYNWLVADLTAAQSGNYDNIIVSMHAGIYTVGTFGSNPNDYALSLGMRDQLQPIFAQYGVDLVLQAHDHIYSRTKPLDATGTPVAENGVVYITALPVGGDQSINKIYNYEGNDYPNNYDKYETSVTTAGYARAWTEISVNGTQITVSTYSIDGAVSVDNPVLIDSFTIG